VLGVSPITLSDSENYRHWLILNLLPDIGRVRFNALIRHFGSPQDALSANAKQLAQVPNLGQLATEALLNWRNLVEVDEEIALIEKHGVSLTCIHDSEYPQNLRHLSAPPPLLYFRGTIEPMDEAAVAIIGSRKMSLYGREAADIIAKDLARAGITIVSGLAIGVDSAAHRAALDAGSRTLAVLGNGLATVYPAQHRRLAEEVAEHGALISEMPMGATPDPGSFPQRNSIIAGLSLGVVVVEAGLKSGTQSTANFALEENRAVYAVPGDITRVNSMGTNQLIKEGARLITSGNDVIEDLAPQLANLRPELASAVPSHFDTSIPLPTDLSEDEKNILAALHLDPLSIESLTDALQEKEIPMGILMSALLNLELRGLIRQEPGRKFRRIR